MASGPFSPEVNRAIINAADQFGWSRAAMFAIARVESINGNPNAVSPSGLHHGLFQLSEENQTRYGVVDPYDPVQNAMAAAQLMRDNRARFLNAMGREPTAAELYMMHQQGPRGGLAAIRAAERDPTQRATAIPGLPARNVRANNGGGLSIGQFVARFTGALERDAARFTEEFPETVTNVGRGIVRIGESQSMLTADARRALRGGYARAPLYGPLGGPAVGPDLGGFPTTVEAPARDGMAPLGTLPTPGMDGLGADPTSAFPALEASRRQGPFHYFRPADLRPQAPDPAAPPANLQSSDVNRLGINLTGVQRAAGAYRDPWPGSSFPGAASMDFNELIPSTIPSFEDALPRGGLTRSAPGMTPADAEMLRRTQAQPGPVPQAPFGAPVELSAPPVRVPSNPMPGVRHGILAPPEPAPVAPSRFAPTMPDTPRAGGPHLDPTMDAAVRTMPQQAFNQWGTASASDGFGYGALPEAPFGALRVTDQQPRAPVPGLARLPPMLGGSMEQIAPPGDAGQAALQAKRDALARAVEQAGTDPLDRLGWSQPLPDATGLSAEAKREMLARALMAAGAKAP